MRWINVLLFDDIWRKVWNQVVLWGPHDKALQLLHIQGTLRVCPTFVIPETHITFYSHFQNQHNIQHIHLDYMRKSKLKKKKSGLIIKWSWEDMEVLTYHQTLSGRPLEPVLVLISLDNKWSFKLNRTLSNRKKKRKIVLTAWCVCLQLKYIVMGSSGWLTLQSSISIPVE